MSGPEDGRGLPGPFAVRIVHSGTLPKFFFALLVPDSRELAHPRVILFGAVREVVPS